MFQITTINPHWFKGRCPSCRKLIYIDEINKRTYHQAPLCDWYTNFVSSARNEGGVILEENAALDHLKNLTKKHGN